MALRYYWMRSRLKEYHRPNFRAVFMEEANYEFEHNTKPDVGTPANLRRQEYWTMLSGAAGQLYGSKFTWRLPTGLAVQLEI
jgi:hypothetical protein